eukprot:6825854-Pyramimonas_sp.AAC.1
MPSASPDWSHIENILSRWHSIGCTQGISASRGGAPCTRRGPAGMPSASPDWSHVGNILSRWHSIGCTQGIFLVACMSVSWEGSAGGHLFSELRSMRKESVM